ncbi:MAG: sugar ABC transporter ATP-binding protein [Actinobacteria bacterium]|nr:sugar ABC transporter ATP-binding protein [Actinomycetota bacterium]
MGETILKLENISKHFDGVKALADFNIEFQKGEIIGLVGENGAGKSTLLNIIWGAFPPDDGRIFINGELITKITPQKAQELGLSIIFQHRRLMLHMTVAENIFLNKMPKKRLGIIDYNKMNKEALKLMMLLDLDINCKKKVIDLTAEEKQLVEIAKACSYQSKILLMDEPTSALRQNEVERLFNLMRNLKSKGSTVVFISHRLKEVFEISDRIVVIRDGRCVTEGPKEQFTLDDIVKYMTGKNKINNNIYTHTISTAQEEIFLEARDICTDKVNKISFQLHKGEILGFAGLGGSGIKHLFNHIFGLQRKTSGELFIYGKRINLNNPIHAIKNNIGYVPEDRQLSGEFLNMSVVDNVCIPSAQKKPQFSTIKKKRERISVKEYINKLSLKTPSDQTMIRNLSGGNQQKAIFAKWLNINSNIIIMNEPTAGIDVSAKIEVIKLIKETAQQGKGILYETLDIDELINVSDRIIVIYKGEIFKEFAKKDFDSKKIYLAINGIKETNDGGMGVYKVI